MTAPLVPPVPRLTAAEVELRVRSDSGWLCTLRRVAADLATRADFDLDAVADSQLAVDELCATLTAGGFPSSTLVCRFRIEHGALAVYGTVDRGPRPVDLWSFNWLVLTTLADEVRVWATDPDEAHPVGALHISMHLDPNHADRPR